MGTETLTDEQLVARCKVELPYEVEAYSELLRRHQPVAFRTCLKMLGSTQDAEEACQDVFLQVFHKIHAFEGRAQFKTWLYRIVFNRCVERRRHLARRRERHAEFTETTQLEEATREDPALQRELSGKVRDALDHLADDERHMIALRYGSGLSLQEIADVLEIGLSAAKMRLYRAQERFKATWTSPPPQAHPNPALTAATQP